MKTYNFLHPDNLVHIKIECDKLILGEIKNEAYWQCLKNSLIIAQFPINWTMYIDSCI